MIEEENIKYKLLKKMYKKSIDRIFELNNINIPISQKDDLMISKSIHVLEKSKKYTWVVGGACIDRCDGNIEELALCFYYDILMPINFAMQYDLPVAIYIDTPIEVFCDNEREYEKWINLAEQISAFINKLNNTLNKKIYIIRRDKGYKSLDSILEHINFKDDELKGLYDLVPSIKNNYFSSDLLLHFRRSICQYLPEYLEKYFNTEIHKIIVVEEISQLKAILKAKKINKNIIPQVYIDMPSVTCKNRMHRSPTGKIKIFDDVNNIMTDKLFNQFINKISFKNIYETYKTDNFLLLIDKLKTEWRTDDIYD